MQPLLKIVEDSIADGVMTQAQHDQILKEIHRDGKIDSEESALLSKLFSAVQDGRLKIVETEKEKLKARQVLADGQADTLQQQALNASRAQATDVISAVSRVIAAGTMTQREHDRIMKLIHKDGRIDDAEREQMSRLFAAIKSGKLVISADAPGASKAVNVLDLRSLAEQKRLSVEHDESASLGPSKVEHSTKPESPTTESGPHNERDCARQKPAVLKNSPAVPAETLPGEDVRKQDRSESVVNPTESTGEMPGEMFGDAPSDEFLRSFGRLCQPRAHGKTFELHNDRLLDIRLESHAWIKTGSMVGYYGQIRFSREGIFEHGLKKLIKKAATGEGSTLTKASGAGNLYLADAGKKISVIDLRGQALVVSGRNILAFEPSVTWDIVFLKQIAAAVVGGLFNVRLQGSGMAAITTHFDPIVLRVAPGQPVNTDYHATVAWSGGLAPTIRADVGSQTLIGRTSGETLQMQFQGDGFVIIQPFEEGPAATE